MPPRKDFENDVNEAKKRVCQNVGAKLADGKDAKQGKRIERTRVMYGLDGQVY